eukprot:311791-Chlamydomonas_euryale.AAC.1
MVMLKGEGGDTDGVMKAVPFIGLTKKEDAQTRGPQVDMRSSNKREALKQTHGPQANARP